MATKAAVAAVTIPEPSADDIAALGCWSPAPGDVFVTRKDFTYNGQAIPKGIDLRVGDRRTARKLINARLLMDPKELT